MVQEKILPTFVLKNHGYVQRAGSERRVEYCIRYHRDLTPEKRDLTDAIPLVYGESVALGSEKAAVFLERDRDNLKRPSDGNAQMKDGANRSSNSKKSDSELSAFVLEARHAPEDD